MRSRAALFPIRGSREASQSTTRSAGGSRVASGGSEQIHLALCCGPLPLLRGGNRCVEGPENGTAVAQFVECARLGEGLHSRRLTTDQSIASQSVPRSEICRRVLAAALDDRSDCRHADVFHGSQTKANRAGVDFVRSTLNSTALIDARRKDGNPARRHSASNETMRSVLPSSRRATPP